MSGAPVPSLSVIPFEAIGVAVFALTGALVAGVGMYAIGARAALKVLQDQKTSISRSLSHSWVETMFALLIDPNQSFRDLVKDAES